MARKTAAEIRQMLRARFPGQQGEVLVQVFEALSADVTALDAWGDALATKLNADFTAQNALAQTPAHTLDTNYVGPGV